MSLFCFQDCIISDKRSPVITVLSFSLQEICPFSFGYLQDFFFIFHFEQFDWRVWLWSMSLFWDNSWPLSLHIFHLPNSLFLLLLWFHSVVLYCPVALGHSFLFHSFFFSPCISFGSFIDVSLSSLVLSSVMWSLLMSPSKEFISNIVDFLIKCFHLALPNFWCMLFTGPTS